ncbi:MAG: FAD:protein FMN transferase, partial [Nevskiales bacterium]
VTRIDAQTWTVLAAAQRLSRLSEGAFDIAVGARLQDWGYLPPGPGPLSSEGNWNDIELLDDARVRFHRPLSIDLGGIAKGYAVDCAIAVLREAGIETALVNAGGDLRVLGPQRQVQLRHPQNPAFSAHALSLSNEALATSANYYSRRASTSGEVSPLLDPRSRQPWLGAASVSVRAADCMSADALTKVVLFAAPEVADRVLEACDAQAYVLNPLEAAA